jgi:hypothetical protein
VRLQLPGAWLDGSPLTMADLEREQKQLADGQIRLMIQRRHA